MISFSYQFALLSFGWIKISSYLEQQTRRCQNELCFKFGQLFTKLFRGFREGSGAARSAWGREAVATLAAASTALELLILLGTVNLEIWIHLFSVWTHPCPRKLKNILFTGFRKQIRLPKWRIGVQPIWGRSWGQTLGSQNVIKSVRWVAYNHLTTSGLNHLVFEPLELILLCFVNRNWKEKNQIWISTDLISERRGLCLECHQISRCIFFRFVTRFLND